MNRIFNFLFPALMILGMLLSALVIGTSLQAAVAPNTTATQTQNASAANSENLVAYGRVLFVAKGCYVCHRHADVAESRANDFYVDSAPNLTATKRNAEYLHTWLKDPKAIKPNTEMPNLELKKTEIDALIAFLTKDR